MSYVIKDSIQGNSFIKSGGTSAQFLKADGSIDTNSYITGITNSITGNGTINTIPKFNTSSTLTNSNLTDNGSIISSSIDMSVNGISLGRGSANNSTNTVLGNGSFGVNSSGQYSVAIGPQVLASNTSGNYNFGIGSFTLNANLTGSSNVAIGYGVMNSSNSDENTGVGNSVFFNLTTGSKNTSIGSQSLNNITTGSGNIALGWAAGFFRDSNNGNQTSDHSIFIGYNTRSFAAGQTNEIVIGDIALGLGSNSIVLGNDAITKTALKGNVLIGTTNNNGIDKLQVNGSLSATSATFRPTDTTGSVLIQNTRASNTSKIQEWKNIAGTTTTSIDGNGFLILNRILAQSSTNDALVGFSDAGSGVVAIGQNVGAAGAVIQNTAGGDIAIFQGTNQITFDNNANITANSFIKDGGTSSQFLMADGSVTTGGGGGGTIGGSGSVNRISKFSSSTAITNSNLSDDGTTISSTTDMSVNGITLGRGTANSSTNTIFGSAAFANNSSGTFNVGIGVSSLALSVSGSFNVGVGSNTLIATVTGASNVGIGYSVLRFNDSSDNTGIGAQALRNLTTGFGNVGIGSLAGARLNGNIVANQTSSNSVYIGNNSTSFAAGQTNEIAIGYFAAGSGSNTTVIGNSLTTKAKIFGALTADTIAKVNGTASQFLMANGTVTEFKEYTAVFNTVGASVSTVVLYNTIGSIVWSNIGTGRWQGVLSGAFPLDKCAFYANNGNGGLGVVNVFRLDDNSIRVQTYDLTGTPANDIINKGTVTIKVFP